MVTGQLTFTSSKSMEIQVLVDVQQIFQARSLPIRAMDAFFTFVSLDEQGKALSIPVLKVSFLYLKLSYQIK